MLLIDDLILAPGKFVFWVLRQVHEAAEKEMENEADRLTADLSELHRLLESGAIGEREFDLREREILDRLDELRDRGPHSARGDSDDAA